MAQRNDIYQKFIIKNIVNNPIVANADPETVSAFYFL